MPIKGPWRAAAGKKKIESRRERRSRELNGETLREKEKCREKEEGTRDLEQKTKQGRGEKRKLKTVSWGEHDEGKIMERERQKGNQRKNTFCGKKDLSEGERG